MNDFFVGVVYGWFAHALWIYAVKPIMKNVLRKEKNDL